MDAKVKVGDVLRDNDKRKNGATVTVIAVVATVAGGYAMYHTGKRKVKISFDRIFTDGAVRAQGYNLVKEA